MAAKFEQSEGGKSGEEFVNYEAIPFAMMISRDKNVKVVIVKTYLGQPVHTQNANSGRKGILNAAKMWWRRRSLAVASDELHYTVTILFLKTCSSILPAPYASPSSNMYSSAA